MRKGRFGGCRIALFFVLGEIFLFCGGEAFLQGILQKMGVLVWCFCGEDVVICVVDVVI
jgi:hypothetical protein